MCCLEGHETRNISWIRLHTVAVFLPKLGIDKN